MPGYRGLIKLAHQTGGVKSVDAVAVFDGEEFEYWEDEHGSHLRHKPDLDTERKDEDIKYVYARITMATGGIIVAVMNRTQVEKIRSGSKSRNGPGWTQHWGEMAKKTIIKRGLKYVPQSTSDKAVGILERAIEMDNRTGGFLDGDVIDGLCQERQAERDADWKKRLEGGQDDAAQEPIEGEPAGDKEAETEGSSATDASVPEGAVVGGENFFGSFLPRSHLQRTARGRTLADMG